MWSIAFSFEDMEQAGVAYKRVRDLVFGRDIDASVYRIRLDGVPLLIMLGDSAPSAGLRERVEAACARGQKVALPDDIRDYLVERREIGKLPGAFWEGNYRPGIVTNRRERRRRKNGG